MIDFNVLIDFEWHRDRKGYHLAPRNSLKASPRPYDMRDDEIVIVPNGRHSDSIRYRPFTRGGDLCVAFAAVKSPDELLRFVIDHGPLTDLPFRIFEQVPSAKDSSPNDPVSEELMYSALDSVHHGLGYAEIFRGLLRLKVQSSPRKLASYFESKTSSDFDTIGSLLGSLQLVGDSKRGIRFKMGPPDLLGALWFQLGLKLSNATLRMCPLCQSVFEAGAGTSLRADAKFCCYEHKVEYFNHNRPRLAQRSKQSTVARR